MPRGGHGRTIDFKAWDILLGLDTSISSNVVSQGGSLAFTGPATILRMYGQESLYFFDATRQVGDKMDLTYAVGIFATDAVAAGATADPADEPEYPWLYWSAVSLRCTLTLGDPSLGVSVVRVPAWSSRAMRKIKPRESLVGLLQSTNTTGAPVTEIVMGSARVLIGT